MGLTHELVALIAAAAGADPSAAKRMCAQLQAQTHESAADYARVLACTAFTFYVEGNFADALVDAERSLALAESSGDTEARLYALGMRLIVSAGIAAAVGEDVRDYFVAAWAMKDSLGELDAESRMLAAHFLAEGALATGRISEAVAVLEMLGDVARERRAEDQARTPYPPFLHVQRARVSLFAGAPREAMAHAERAVAVATALGNAPCVALSHALIGLIAANLDDRSRARRSSAAAVRDIAQPQGLIETGAWIVASFAYFALGDRERAAECVLVAGLDTELRGLQVIDRAMGYDILVTAALERGDIEGASEWGERCIPLAAHPAATVVVEELLARLDEARGDPLSAAERASIAAARARLTGRYLDAARVDLLCARAMAAAGLSDQAVTQLIVAADEAERADLWGLRRSVAHELRLLGRRLPPSRGGGWGSLSERERQIAVLAAEGFSYRVIGSVLFLSDRTVQSYMSRILAAVGETSRTALPRLVAEQRLGSPRDDLAPLTVRQWEVASLVSHGCSNHEIAEQLGISVKTAEKHIGEIMQRWSVHSRTSIARLVVSEAMRSAG